MKTRTCQPAASDTENHCRILRVAEGKNCCVALTLKFNWITIENSLPEFLLS